MTDLDQQDLLDRLDGDNELAEELLQIFGEVAPLMVGAVRQAVLTADSRSLASAAHELKGSAASVSAVVVQDLAKELEELGRSDRARHASEELRQLEAAVARVIVEVEGRA